MRKNVLLFVLVLATVLLFPPAGDARADEVRSRCADVAFYAWSSAASEVEFVSDGEAAAKLALPGGRSVEVRTARWAPDALAEAERPGLARRLEARLCRLAELGVPREALDGLRVYLLPVWGFREAGAGGKPVCSYAGMTHKDAIILAGLWWDAERIFLHELGHHLADRLPEFRGCEEKFREYLRMRGYPEGRGLDSVSQARLRWDERADEWFAEDFACWAAARTGMPEPDWRRSAASCGPPDEGALAWFDGLFSRGPHTESAPLRRGGAE